MSEQMKHTPGPWTTNEHFVGVARGTVCQMYRPGDRSSRGLTQSEQIANAHLIASAPELLEAIKRMVRIDYGKIDWAEFDGAVNQALAAIRKAEGGGR